MRDNTITHAWVRTPPYYPVEGAQKIGPSGHYPFKHPIDLKVCDNISMSDMCVIAAFILILILSHLFLSYAEMQLTVYIDKNKILVITEGVLDCPCSDVRSILESVISSLKINPVLVFVDAYVLCNFLFYQVYTTIIIIL